MFSGKIGSAPCALKQNNFVSHFCKGIKCNNVEVNFEMLDICEITYSIKADSFELKRQLY